MGRLMDFLVLIIAIFGIYVVQFSGAAMLDPLRTEMLEEDIQPKYNAEENFNDMYEMVVKWVPTTALIGLIVLIGYREYRRQRITALRGPR